MASKEHDSSISGTVGILKAVKYLSLIFFFSTSCSLSDLSRKIYGVQEGSGDDNLPINGSEKKVIVVATGNLEGNLLPVEEKISWHPKQKNKFLKVGGAAIFSSYVKILREKFQDQVVLLDGGNLFFDGSDFNEAQKVIDFYSHLQYDGIIFSEKELFSLNENSENHKYLEKKKIPLINSNIINLKKWSLLNKGGLLPWRLVTVNDVSIGIMGVTGFDALSFKPHSQLKGYYFEDPAYSIIKTRSTLVKKGAEVIVLITHLKSNCHYKDPQKSQMIKRYPEFKLHCPNAKDPLSTLLEKIPPNFLDAIIVGNTDSIDGFIGNIPILQNKGNGEYFSRLELFYDKENKRVISEKTFIYPPTKLCLHFFADTNDCLRKGPGFFTRVFRGRKERELVPARFLGVQITKDLEVFDLVFNEDI